MQNSVAAPMGAFLLLTMILQTFRGHISSAFIIHEDENGNPVITFNGSSFEDLFPDYYEYNSTDLYGDLDYFPYEIAATKNPTGSARALLPCYLALFLPLHLLLFLPQGTRIL